MRWYLWVVLILLTWYIAYYYRSPRSIAILQTSLPEFSFDLLLQRQPIVISEQVSNLETLRDAWFPSNKTDLYQEPERDAEGEGGDIWRRNSYKYLLLQPQDNTEVILYPAGKKMTSENVPPSEEKLLAIKCKPNQVVILPFRWHFYIPNISYNWMGVHDWVTRFLP